MDYVGFKSCYTIIVSMEIILIIGTLMFGPNPHPAVHTVVVVLAYVLIGGHWAIFPAIFSKIFGNKLGSLLYSISFVSYAISAIIAYFLYWLITDLDRSHSEIPLTDIHTKFNAEVIMWLNRVYLILCYLSMIPIGNFDTSFKYKIHQNQD